MSDLPEPSRARRLWRREAAGLRLVPTALLLGALPLLVLLTCLGGAGAIAGWAIHRDGGSEPGMFVGLAVYLVLLGWMMTVGNLPAFWDRVGNKLDKLLPFAGRGLHTLATALRDAAVAAPT